jgi:hypothetical protein
VLERRTVTGHERLDVQNTFGGAVTIDVPHGEIRALAACSGVTLLRTRLRQWGARSPEPEKQQGDRVGVT